MPHDNPRSENTRAERSRSESSLTASMMSAPFGEMGARSVTAGWRAQQRILDVLSDISRQWAARAAAEAELALRLPNKLTSARSVPDAMSAYQEWFDEWMSMFGEDGQRWVSDGRKLVDTGMRCFAETTPAAAN